MSILSDAVGGLSDLNLWYAIQANDTLNWMHISELIPLRWPYLRDNWPYVKSVMQSKVSSTIDPDYTLQLINKLDSLVQLQRFSNINPFTNYNTIQYYGQLFELLEVYMISASNEEQQLISKTLSRVSRFTKNNFLTIRSQLQAAHDTMSDNVGGNDDDYNTAVGRSSSTQFKDISISDTQTLSVWLNGIKSINFILANIYSLDTFFIDPFALARANANNPNFNVSTYSNGYMAQMYYGEDLPSLAKRAMGNPDKWLEIAIANGLKPPYIDEIGEVITLISNGNGNQINLSATDAYGNPNINKLYINQPVLLQSTISTFAEQRIILNLRSIPISGEIVIELDGDPNLDRYLISDGAYARVFKPNTTNSNFFILIPTNNIKQDQMSDVPWFLKNKREDEKNSKVDFKLSDDHDLVFDATGDLSLSYGAANALQAIKLKLITERGTLPRHRMFGIDMPVGKSNSDAEKSKNELSSSIVRAVESDNRFSRVLLLNVESTLLPQGGVAFLVKLIVQLAGSKTPIPISFSINPS